MATHHHFQADDRGATFRPQSMQIYRRRVSTITPGDNPPDQKYTVPTWGKPIRQWSWVPISLNWGSNGKMSVLQFKVVLGQGSSKERERAEDYRVSPGDQIELQEMAPGAGPEDKFRQKWFTGHLGQEAMLIQAHPDVESATLVAYGPELLLSHKIITGRWCANTDEAFLAMKGDLTDALTIRDNVWEARLPVIMNPGGRGNAWGGTVAGETLDWQLTSNKEGPSGYASSSANNKCKVFTSAGVTAGELVSEKWTAYTALRSVVEWVDDYDVISFERTNWDAIETTLDDTPIGQVNLTGLTLLKAMNMILVPAGFGFAIEPWADSRQEHRLLVYRLSEPKSFATVNMAPIVGGNVEMTEFAGQRAMVQRVDFIRDNHAVKNDILIMGDTKITERSILYQSGADSDLRPAWDTDTYDLDEYDSSNVIGGGKWASAAAQLEWNQRYRLGGSAYLTYALAFRTFAWNEDGALSDVINDGTDPLLPTLTNFKRGTDDQQVQYRPRPPLYRVAYRTDTIGGTAGAFEPPLVGLSINGDDDSFVKIPSSTYILSKERCLIYFRAKDLAEWYPWAKAQNKSGGETLAKLYGHLNFATALWNAMRSAGSEELVINLTAGFEMDDAATVNLPRNLDSSWPFDAKVMIPMPARWKYRDVEGSVGDTAAVDDSASIEMTNYASQVRDVLEDATGHGSIVLRGLHRAYRPGQGMTKLAGRNIDLSLPGRRQNKAASIYPVIAGIQWHFVGGVNKTEILLETGQLALPG